MKALPIHSLFGFNLFYRFRVFTVCVCFRYMFYNCLGYESATHFTAETYFWYRWMLLRTCLQSWQSWYPTEQYWDCTRGKGYLQSSTQIVVMYTSVQLLVYLRLDLLKLTRDPLKVVAGSPVLLTSTNLCDSPQHWWLYNRLFLPLPASQLDLQCELRTSVKHAPVLQNTSVITRNVCLYIWSIYVHMYHISSQICIKLRLAWIRIHIQ